MSAVPKEYISEMCCEACGRPFENVTMKGGIAVWLDGIEHRGGKVKASPRETQLMQELLRTYPEPMIRERIFLNLYGSDSDVQDKTLDVHIWKLRKLLRAIGLTIENVHGVGFKIVVVNA